MNILGLFLLLLLCFYAEANNNVIRTQFSPDHKFCLDKEPSFLGFMDDISHGVASGSYVAAEIFDILDTITGRRRYSSYEEGMNARKEREIHLRQANPFFELRTYMNNNGLKCALYDKKIEFLSDGSMVETPYNFRPLS